MLALLTAFFAGIAVASGHWIIAPALAIIAMLAYNEQMRHLRPRRFRRR